MTVICRRSLVAFGSPERAALRGSAGPPVGWPQLRQKRAMCGLMVAQLGQRKLAGAPQELQNRESSASIASQA
jgi:hypothetical protein